MSRRVALCAALLFCACEATARSGPKSWIPALRGVHVFDWGPTSPGRAAVAYDVTGSGGYVAATVVSRDPGARNRSVVLAVSEDEWCFKFGRSLRMRCW